MALLGTEVALTYFDSSCQHATFAGHLFEKDLMLFSALPPGLE